MVPFHLPCILNRKRVPESRSPAVPQSPSPGVPESWTWHVSCLSDEWLAFGQIVNGNYGLLAILHIPPPAWTCPNMSKHVRTCLAIKSETDDLTKSAFRVVFLINHRNIKTFPTPSFSPPERRSEKKKRKRKRKPLEEEEEVLAHPLNSFSPQLACLVMQISYFGKSLPASLASQRPLPRVSIHFVIKLP